MLIFLLNIKDYMLSYEEVVSNMQTCVFCDYENNLIVEKIGNFIILAARAPYTKDHILILPIEHYTFLHELSIELRSELFDVVNTRNNKLHKVYNDVLLLLRDGSINGNIGKSLNHLHFHLIPDFDIGHEKNVIKNRVYLDDITYLDLVKDIRKRFV